MRPRELTLFEVFILAKPNCPDCGGSGCGLKAPICECVCRRVFEICYRRYHSVTHSSSGTRLTTIYWSRPSEEFRADFEMTARRALIGRPRLQKVFDLFFAGEYDAVDCLMRLRISQGVLSWHVDRIKRIVGRALREQGVYPIDQYFARKTQPVKARPVKEPAKVHRMPLTYEFKKAA